MNTRLGGAVLSTVSSFIAIPGPRWWHTGLGCFVGYVGIFCLQSLDLGPMGVGLRRVPKRPFNPQLGGEHCIPSCDNFCD